MSLQTEDKLQGIGGAAKSHNVKLHNVDMLPGIAATVPMLDVINAIEICFFAKMEAKTSWGRNELKELFLQAVKDALDTGGWLPPVELPKPEPDASAKEALEFIEKLRQAIEISSSS